jgi:hypothetical protein
MMTMHQQALWEDSTSQAFGAVPADRICEIAGGTARWTLVTTRDDTYLLIEHSGAAWPRLPDGWLDFPVLTACAMSTVHALLMGWQAA